MVHDRRRILQDPEAEGAEGPAVQLSVILLACLASHVGGCRAFFFFFWTGCDDQRRGATQNAESPPRYGVRCAALHS